MKLNFTTLASQINDSQHQSSTHHYQQSPTHLNSHYTSSSHLNYYRKSVVQQKADHQFSRHRKSQINQQSSPLMLGSSILESYFSAKQSSVSEQTNHPKVNLEVMYPYQISASLNTSKINEEIDSIGAKGILNESAIKFVKKQITKNLSKSKQKNQKHHQINQSMDEMHQSIFLDTSLEVDDQNLTDMLNKTDNQFQNVEEASILGTTVSSKLFKHFLKQSTQKFITESKQHVNKNSFSAKQIKTPLTKKKLHTNNSKKTQNPHYMKPIDRQQNSTQTQKKIIPTQAIKLQQALKQLRPKPSLELTKSSPFTQKIIQQRQSQYHSKKTNVFDSLYNQAYKRQCMYQLKKQSQEKQIDQQINQKKTLQTNRAKKYKVEGTFMERLQKSIQRKYYKEYLTKKYSVNPKTGQPFFFPDTNCSKRTYQQLFHRSLQKIHTQPNESLLLTATIKQKHSAKINNKKPSQVALSNHFSYTHKSGRMTKQSSLNKHSQIERLNRSMQIMSKSSREINQLKNKATQDQKDSKVISRIMGLFYPFINNKNSSSQEKASINELGFQKTYEALYQLSEKEYLILSPLFQQVQQLQKSSKVTSLIFSNLLTRFIKKISHYDRIILREKAQNKLNHQTQINQTKHTSRPQQKRVQGKRNHTINQDQNCSYRPRINEISASMEKINPKYEAELYYV